MSITTRIERMFGRNSLPQSRLSDEPPAAEEVYTSQTIDSEGEPMFTPLSPPPVYQQWYERDEKLAIAEKDSLEAKGVDAECSTLPDARACFTATVAGTRVAFICQYAHPIEPVEVQILEDIDAPNVVDKSGRVDLFAHDGFTWNADVRLGDVAQHVATMLSVSAANKSKSSDTHVADEARDES